MRVIFLGTPEFAVPSLQALTAGGCQVCAVFTQPDRPSGRGQRPAPPAVKAFALGAGIPVYQPEKIRNPENRPLVESLAADFIVVTAYGQILPAWLLQLPPYGCVNVHASILPRYRGAAPVAWAIIRGEVLTGVTTMLMDEQLDTGPMLLKREFAIGPDMTAGELSEILAKAGAELLLPTLNGLRNRTLQPVPQDDRLASFAPRITKEMARIDWNQDAPGLHNFIRGLNPQPLAFTEFRGQRLQVLKSSAAGGRPAGERPPGILLEVTGRGISVTCGESGVLELLEVQPEGKRRMPAREFANGARIRPGDRIFA